MTLKQRTGPMLSPLASDHVSRTTRYLLALKEYSPAPCELAQTRGLGALAAARTIRASREAERAARGAYISRKVGAS